MDWIKIPTDSILYSEFKDSELITIIKYQALYCQLEKAPSESQMNRIFNKKEMKLIQSYAEVVQELCENQINQVSKKRNKDKENYKQKQTLEKNSASGTNAKRTRNGGADKIREDKNKEIKKEKKLSASEIVDWESLFTYWEENKTGGKYKNDESRHRQLTKLRELTQNDFTFAKEAILHCIDNGYQGFSNGNELYYKRHNPPQKASSYQAFVMPREGIQ